MKPLKPIPTDVDVMFTPIEGIHAECEWCGICSFAHIHRAGTLPKDFERMQEPKERVDEGHNCEEDIKTCEKCRKRNPKEPEKCEHKESLEGFCYFCGKDLIFANKEEREEWFKKNKEPKPEPKQEPPVREHSHKGVSTCYDCPKQESEGWEEPLSYLLIRFSVSATHNPEDLINVKKDIESFFRNLLREEKGRLINKIKEL